MPSRRRFAAALAVLTALFALTGCPKKADPTDGGTPSTVNRCEVDLAALGLTAATGTGASAKVIDSADQLIGGEGATGTLGDVLLQNDRIRVIVEKPGRTIGPMPNGGGLIDADFVRPAGQPGQDQFGRINLFYALGRLSRTTDVEVLADGASGGPAVVAATGVDAQHDLINLESVVRNEGGLDLHFVIDATKPLAVHTTTYYVLSPGETRVRMLTAFCNDGTSPVQAPIIELTDVGTFGLFIPEGCKNGLGANNLDPTNCLVQKAPWLASQGDGITYGLRSYQLDDLKRPVTDNAVLGYAGVVGYLVQGHDLNGLLTWADASATKRPGEFAIRPGGQRLYLRDFFVAKDVAEVSATIAALDGTATGTVDVTATTAAGAPAKAARVAVVRTSDDQMVTLLEAGADGKGRLALPPGDYRLSAALEGSLPGTPVPVTVTAGGTATATVALGLSHQLTVHAADPFGAPVPAKLTLLCKGGTCPFSADTWHQYVMLDSLPDGVGAVAFVPPAGVLTVTVPAGEYEVVLSRGPEYSAWPDTWPLSGAAVDLRTADQSVNGVLAHVVDSTGWMSADLHVHAIASSDSATANTVRAANFLAEGVDVLLSTDHEVITDFAPAVKAIGGDGAMATMIGEEVTSFTHGHFNTFPLVRKDLPNGGAFDHAGGWDAPTLRLSQLFPAIKAEHPGAVAQINHPRGGSGAFSLLKLDTATLATHGTPSDFLMAPAPDATADDTKLLDASFDAVETANGPRPSFTVLNDWMTFLSRGTVRTATGVSDTHHPIADTGGYSRTYAKVGTDDPKAFQPSTFADAVRGQHAFVTNGPYLRVTARKIDAGGTASGAAVGEGDTLSIAAGSGEGVKLEVDVQGPDWMQVDRVELYTHAAGREAVNGVSNSTWPASRIAESHPLDVGALPLEAVPGQNGLTVRRLHVTDSFTVHPTKDAWYVVMVRGSTRSMFPLHTALPIAYSNAVLVDADGSGKYDDFPLKAQKVHLPLSPKLAPPGVPTPEAASRAITRILSHTHE